MKSARELYVNTAGSHARVNCIPPIPENPETLIGTVTVLSVAAMDWFSIVKVVSPWTSEEVAREKKPTAYSNLERKRMLY